MKKFYRTLVQKSIAMLITAGAVVYAQQSPIDELRSKAEQGDARAQTELGKLYEEGKGIPASMADAVS